MNSNYIYSYWTEPSLTLMYKRVSPFTALLLQVHGEDLNADFKHRHERVTFASQDHLDKWLKNLEETDASAWEDLLIKFILLGQEKLSLMVKARVDLEASGDPFFKDLNGF